MAGRTLIIDNDLAEMARVAALIESVAGESRLPERRRMPLQVAVDEIVSNVIRHAWPQGGRHRIEIQVKVLRDSLQVEIVDDGAMFDPTGPAPPPGKPDDGKRQHGGRGLRMAAASADAIDYQRLDGFNHTRITMHLAKAS